MSVSPAARVLLALLAAAWLLAATSPAGAQWGGCEDCHSGTRAASAGFPYGICAHCHQVAFSPRHDPEAMEGGCQGCHTPASLHYLHPWEEACEGCHGPLLVAGPRIFELDAAQAETRQMVAVKGVGFGHAQGTGAVKVGRIAYGGHGRQVLSWSNTEIRLRLPVYWRWPQGQKATRDVKVIVGGACSNRVPVEICKP